MLFTYGAQQAEDNYPMLYWTLNSYHIISFVPMGRLVLMKLLEKLLNYFDWGQSKFCIIIITTT